MSATSPESDRRWSEAAALLGNPEDEDILRNARRRRKQIWWLVGAVTVGLMVAAFLVGFLLASGDDPSDDDSSGPLWLSVVGVALSAGGLLLIVTYVIKARRAGLYKLGPLSVLSYSQRRSLRRQVLGKEPLQSVHLPLLRHFASRMVTQNWSLLLPSGLMLGQFGSFLGSPGRWRAVFVVALVLLFLAAAVQVQRDGRRAERFLAEHPEPPQDAVEPG